MHKYLKVRNLSEKKQFIGGFQYRSSLKQTHITYHTTLLGDRVKIHRYYIRKTKYFLLRIRARGIISGIRFYSHARYRGNAFGKTVR